jgi:hypothetical protein
MISPRMMGQEQMSVPGQGHYKTAIFDSSFQKALYKGSLDIAKFHLSGIFLLKRTSGNSVRIVFSNELGMSFFDFEVKDDEILVHSCNSLLDRVPFLKYLENDFFLLLFTCTNLSTMKRERSGDPKKLIFGVMTARGSFRCTYGKDSGKIRRIQTVRSTMGRTDLRVYGDKLLYPEKINIVNPAIRLHIRMTLLPG